MTAESTRRRELWAMTTAMEETGLTKAIIITESPEAEEVLTPAGVVQVLPAAQFLAQQNPWQ